jgi:hypothetical protein
MAGMVSRLPFPFSGRAAAASSSFALDGVQYDYALGGMPWLSAINDERKMTRAGAQMRKDQFDNSKEPGEQSLANWWLRNQATFIGGEGLLYQDPDPIAQSNLQNKHAIQYGHSVGLNPWTNGKLTLLRKTTLRVADGTANPTSWWAGTTARTGSGRPWERPSRAMTAPPRPRSRGVGPTRSAP